MSRSAELTYDAPNAAFYVRVRARLDDPVGATIISRNGTLLLDEAGDWVGVRVRCAPSEIAAGKREWWTGELQQELEREQAFEWGAGRSVASRAQPMVVDVDRDGIYGVEIPLVYANRDLAPTAVREAGHADWLRRTTSKPS